MIKAKVVSIAFSESVGSIPKLDLETYLEDPVVQELFCGVDFWDGLDIVITTEEEYKAMDSVSNGLRQSLLEEREKTKQLEETIKRLKERSAQEVAEVDIHPDGTIVVKKKRVSELEKEVEKLRSESRELAAKNIEIRYERTITKMTNSRLSEIVKEYKETIQKLREENTSIKDEIKDLKERLAQDTAGLDIHPDGTMVFKSKRVSELEKEVEKLEEENKALKEDKFTMKITGGLFYKKD